MNRFYGALLCCLALVAVHRPAKAVDLEWLGSSMSQVVRPDTKNSLIYDRLPPQNDLVVYGTTDADDRLLTFADHTAIRTSSAGVLDEINGSMVVGGSALDWLTTEVTSYCWASPYDFAVKAISGDYVQWERASSNAEFKYAQKRYGTTLGKVKNMSGSWLKVKVKFTAEFDPMQPDNKDFGCLFTTLGMSYESPFVTGHLDVRWNYEDEFLISGVRTNQFGNMAEDNTPVTNIDADDPYTVTKSAIVFLAPYQELKFRAHNGTLDNSDVPGDEEPWPGYSPYHNSLFNMHLSGNLPWAECYRQDTATVEVISLGTVAYPDDVPANPYLGSVSQPSPNTTEP